MVEHRIEEAWRRLPLADMTGAIVVVGGGDAGKSTFSRWLASQLLEHHERVAWLDTDPGQATLGLPATMSLAILDEPPDSLPAADASFFVGSTAPSGHMLPMIVGAGLLAREAERRGASATVVDTTGMIATAGGGVALKHWKLAELAPRSIIALARDAELEPLLGPLRRDPRFALHELPVSGAARRRNADERAAHRRAQLREYFGGTAPVAIDATSIPVYDLDRAAPGRILAFEDARGFVVALGILDRRHETTLHVNAPPMDLDRVRAVRFGSLAIDPASGDELG